MALRILHTSDWHLGRTLADIDRRADFASFLDWMIGVLNEYAPDVLLIAGDVFDTTMPSTDAQRLYYDFLRRAVETPVRAVVVTAGNHDSQRFLAAAKPLLESFRVFVAGETPEEQAFVLRDAAGRPQLGIAAVPYLREGDVRVSGFEATNEERIRKWEEGVRAHYDAVRALLRERSGSATPLVAMGHLFVTGSEVSPGRTGPAEFDPSVYVGSLRNVTADAFGDGWVYVALGHIHHAQTVSARVPMRFSGSPLALHFGHAAYRHQVVLLTVGDDGELSEPEILPVPQPRRLVRLEGTLAELTEEIGALSDPQALPAVVEATYAGERANAPYAVEELRRAAERAGVLIGAVHCRPTDLRDERTDLPNVSLEDITPAEVFRRVLDAHVEDETERRQLTALFEEVLEDVRLARAPSEADPDAAKRAALQEGN